MTTNIKYSDLFETRKRPNDQVFICLRDGVEDSHPVKKLVRSIHMLECFDALPNDWIYLKIFQAFEYFEESGLGDYDAEPDVYYHDLKRWFLEPYADGFCDNYLDLSASGKQLVDIIQYGQSSAIREIYDNVNTFLRIV